MHKRRKALSEKGRRMAKARWDKWRARPDDPEALDSLRRHPPIRKGDVIGSFEWRDFRSGEVRRWRVHRGDRIGRVFLTSPDGRRTRSHGWAWILDHLRPFLVGRGRPSEP